MKSYIKQFGGIWGVISLRCLVFSLFVCLFLFILWEVYLFFYFSILWDLLWDLQKSEHKHVWRTLFLEMENFGKQCGIGLSLINTNQILSVERQCSAYSNKLCKVIQYYTPKYMWLSIKIPAALQCSTLNAACNALEDSGRN